MSMDKPFHIEVTVDAPRDVVWRALTEPEQIRHWFGWDYDGLEGEIQYIFVKHATLGDGRIDFGDGTIVELTEDGPRTIIRAVKPGDLDALEWKDVYGDVEEGWIQFFHQLRYAVTHPGARRTINRSGPATLTDLAGEPWHSSRHQRGFDNNGELAVLCVKPPAQAMLVVNTYGLDDTRFAEAEARWNAAWEFLAR